MSKKIVVASECFFKNTWVQKAEMEIVTTKLIFHLATAKHDPPMLYHLNVCENMTFVTFCLYTCMMGKVFLLIRSDQDYVVVNIEEKREENADLPARESILQHFFPPSNKNIVINLSKTDGDS